MATAIASAVIVVYGGAGSPTVHGHPGGASDQHRPDPCEQIFDIPGHAHGLNKQCEGKGGGAGVAKGDFNGDGIADLAVGSPFENVSNVTASGAVHVLYGSTTGLTATGNQLWSEAVIPSGHGPEAGDEFGHALASGDFNGDGFSDLAIGVPFQVCDTTPECGAVHVLYGSAAGLTTTNHQYLTSASRGRFGATLVWADFNGDGIGDLAVGAPHRNHGQDLDFTDQAGAVDVYYGSPHGLTTLGLQSVTEGTDNSGTSVGAGDRPESGGHFGASLSAGDINGDGFHDLVIGEPDKDIGLVYDAGMVHVVFGSPNGLSGFQVISQATAGVAGTPENYDRMGWSVAVGDFNNDGYADVAVGDPFEDIGSAADAGAVQVFYGSNIGLRTDNDQAFDQSAFGNNNPEPGDRFGWSLAAGKFNSGNHVDLAIGAPGEDSAGLVDVGMVSVAYGSSTGLQTTTGVQNWLLGSGGIAETKAAHDLLGYSLTAWNFGNSDRADLVIGIPYREVTLSTGTVVTDAGALLVLYGQSSGLTTTGYQFWTLASSGVLGSPQTGGRFGYALY